MNPDENVRLSNILSGYCYQHPNQHNCNEHSQNHKA